MAEHRSNRSGKQGPSPPARAALPARDPAVAEQRHSPIRRQFNDAFCGPDGSFSIGKFIAIWAQIVVLGHMGTSWDKLIDKPESLLIVLTILVAPDIFKKFLAMRYGGAEK